MNKQLVSELCREENLNKLPEACYSTLPSDGSVILIKRGERGYWAQPGMTVEEAERRNTVFGVTEEQKIAMETGSAFRWA